MLWSKKLFLFNQKNDEETLPMENYPHNIIFDWATEEEIEKVLPQFEKAFNQPLIKIDERTYRVYLGKGFPISPDNVGDFIVSSNGFSFYDEHVIMWEAGVDGTPIKDDTLLTSSRWVSPSTIGAIREFTFKVGPEMILEHNVFIPDCASITFSNIRSYIVIDTDYTQNDITGVLNIQGIGLNKKDTDYIYYKYYYWLNKTSSDISRNDSEYFGMIDIGSIKLDSPDLIEFYQNNKGDGFTINFKMQLDGLDLPLPII